MIKLVIPRFEDMWFREKFMSDEETMTYNKKWGGAIDFSKDKWEEWYAYWVTNPEDKRFYRYIQNEDNIFVVLRCSEWVSDFNELKSLCMIAIETILNPKIASTKYATPPPVAL